MITAIRVPTASFGWLDGLSSDSWQLGPVDKPAINVRHLRAVSPLQEGLVSVQQYAFGAPGWVAKSEHMGSLGDLMPSRGPCEPMGRQDDWQGPLPSGRQCKQKMMMSPHESS